MTIQAESLLALPGHAGFSRGNYLDWLSQGKSDPEAVAISGTEGSNLAHGELRQLIRDRGGDVLARGLGRGSVVLLGVGNGPHALTALLALSNVVTTVLVSPEEPESSIQRLLDLLPVGALVFDENHQGVLGRMAAKQKIPSFRLIAEPGISGRWEFNAQDLPGAGQAKPIRADDAAIIVRTAGTMGEEKLVAWSQTSVAISADTAASWMNLSQADRSLCVMPFSHLHSFVRSCLPVLLRGGSVVCAPGFDKTKVFDWIEAFEPTFITGSPAIFRSLVDRLDAEPRDPKSFSLRFLASGSDKIDQDSVDLISSAFSAPVREFYGMSEVSPMLAASPPGELAQRDNCVGEIIPPWRIRIHGDNASSASGKDGEIVAHGGMINPSLHPDRPPSSDDEYHTGDVGSMVEGNRLRVLGRVDNRINRGGKKISPEQVEAVLRAHSAVQEVAVFPYDDPILNQRVAAAIVLRPGCEFDAAQARGLVGRSLPDYMAPERVIFIDEMPRNKAGKIIRSRLLDEMDRLGASATTGRRQPNSPTEERLAGLFAHALETEDFGLEEDFTVLGGDSFQATMMLMEIEEHFSVLLTPADFMENASVEALAKLLDAKATSIAPPVQLASVSGDEPCDPPHLSTITQGDQSCPLFMAHSVDGYANYASSFGRAFSGDQTLIAMSWKEGPDGPVASLELYAASLVEEMVERVPSGPIAIAGHSFGAQLAYEIAQQFCALGREPALLVLIDDEADLHKRQFGFRKKPLPRDPYHCCCHWLYSYVPKPYPGKVLLVQAADQTDEILADPYCGWRDLAPRIKRIEVPGDHRSMMGEKWVSQ